MRQSYLSHSRGFCFVLFLTPHICVLVMQVNMTAASRELVTSSASQNMVFSSGTISSSRPHLAVEVLLAVPLKTPQHVAACHQLEVLLW